LEDSKNCKVLIFPSITSGNGSCILLKKLFSSSHLTPPFEADILSAIELFQADVIETHDAHDHLCMLGVGYDGYGLEIPNKFKP
jgi:hypothetical protein